MRKEIKGKFTRLTYNNYLVVGTLKGSPEVTYQDILDIAQFYNVDISPDVFGYHMITAEGAEKRGSKQPSNNFSEFIEYLL